MCGIAGIIDFDRRDPAQQLESMLGMLGMIRHRGPDQFGLYQDAAATLGSARLSIIDVSSGQQPIANEDETLWIVFNGEIFNYVELRPQLEARGHRFRTGTDTEVLLHCYEEYGEECLDRFNGQFAFAIWNTRTSSLFLARDRMGVRPLFYCETNGLFLFASEAKALLAHPGVSAEIDPVTLAQIFVYWGPLPGRTIFRGIHEIPPGHFLTHDSGGGVRTKRYWDLSFPPCTHKPSNGEGEYLEEFRNLLVDAALVRLRSDVPVGAYLSGGLDSSVLAGIIARRTSNRLKTFSVTFADPLFDESAYQLRTSRFLGTEHEVIHITHADIARVFPDVIWHTETPITRTAPAPMFLLSKAVHDAGFKVVVTGEGADELLAGYDIFKEARIRRFWARQPASTRRPTLLRLLYADIPALAAAGPCFVSAFFKAGLTEVDSPYYSHLVRWRNSRRTTRFFSERVTLATRAATDGPGPELPPMFSTWGALQRAQYLEATVFLSQYLLSSQGDRVGMAHSVESRLPFLDYRLVEFCNRLPTDLKLRGLTDKYLLRRFGREFLPDDVCKRAKRPYRAPIHRSFFSKPAPEYVGDLLSPAQIRAAGLFRVDAVERLVRKADSGLPLSETDDMAVAGILSAQLVHHQFVANFTMAAKLSPCEDDVKFCGDSALLPEAESARLKEACTNASGAI